MSSNPPPSTSSSCSTLEQGECSEGPRLLSKKEVEGLRQMMHPPPAVRRCLEVVFITLHAARLAPRITALGPSQPLRLDWQEVQRMLTRFQWFYPAMASFDTAPLVARPAVCSYLRRHYMEGPEALTEAKLTRSSQACAVLWRWFTASMARVEVEVQLKEEEEEEQPPHAGDQDRLKREQEHEKLRRQEEEERARREAEGRERQEAEEKEAREAMERGKREIEEREKREREERSRQEAEDSARQDAVMRARQIQEERARREREDRARLEREEMLRREADERAKREAAELLSKVELEQEPVVVPPAGRPPKVKINTTGALKKLLPKDKVRDPQQSLLQALSGIAIPEKKSGPCDKCDKPDHHADDCPFYPNAREDHKDAWAHYGQKKAGAASGPSRSPPVVGRVVRQPGDGSCLFHSLAFGLGNTQASNLRCKIATFVAENPQTCIAGTPLKDWVMWDSGLSVVDYGARMKTGNHWGGAIELAVCALVHSSSVYVYEATSGSKFQCISSFESPTQSTRSIHVVYGGRVHYDALQVT